MKVYKDTIIYIAAPFGVASGGPEALHQLHYYMNGVGFNTAMAYYGSARGDGMPKRYVKYFCKGMPIDEIVDDEKNILIVPESEVWIKERFAKIRKCIWWLGVGVNNCYISKSQVCRSFLSGIRHFNFSGYKKRKKDYKYSMQKDKFADIETHFVASKYAYNFLNEKGIKNKLYLIEPISKEFLSAGKYIDGDETRQNLVLYNPSKPSKVMKKILREESIKFLALKGYTPEQLISIYRKSKLYVDFGAFGGPERIPKETVYNGCNILVGYRNAAKNDFDIAINNEYKIKHDDAKSAIVKIKDMLENYEEQKKDFDHFRKQIGELENNFISQIKNNFILQNE